MVLLLAGLAMAAPYDLTYSGRLNDPTGAPINGTFGVQITLSDGDGDSLGAPFDLTGVDFEDGYFQVVLADVDSDWFAGDVQVGITVDETELLPGQELRSVPRAHRARRAEGVDQVAATPGSDCSRPGDLAYSATDGLVFCTAAGWISTTPAGAVQFFSRTSCPAGWSVFGPASGRAIVGMSGGGSLEGTQGDALSNLEPTEHSHTYTAVTAHNHTFTGTAHGHTFSGTAHGHTFAGTAHGHTFSGSAHSHFVGAAAIDDRNFTGTGATGQQHGLVADAGSYNQGYGSVGKNTNSTTAGGSISGTVAGGTVGSTAAGGSNSTTVAGGSISSAGANSATTNTSGGMPYVQLLSCIKD